MTSFVIVFEILFLILIANSVEPSSQQTRPQSSEQVEPVSSGQTGRSITQSPPVISASQVFDERQDARQVPIGFDEEAREDRPHGFAEIEARRKKRDSQDVAPMLGAPSGSTSATTTTTNSVREQPELSAAELCYLANGGSSLTLTVNEATQVGSVIGTIDVNGDPSLEGGNVDLVDGNDQSTGGSNSMEPFVALLSTATARNNRRLFGRRDTTSSSRQGSDLAPTTTTSSFYSLVAGSAALPTTSSASQTTPQPPQTVETADQHQQPAQLAAAVRVELGTKNLLLARALDKESAEGESSQVVNVRCRPRVQSAGARKQSSYTTIPIRLIITDANDHAPEFVGQLPYVINMSETTPVGSIVSRDILALDKDSAGPHSTIHYRVLDSSDSSANDQHPGQQHHRNHLASHFTFANPLEPTLTLASGLDFESLAAGSFTLTIVAQDQGEPEPLQSVAQVHVNVLDFDDQNPRFLDEKYTLVMDDSQSSLVGQNLRVLPRNLRAEDGDRGINAPILYSFDATNSNNHLSSAADVGAVESGQMLVATSEEPAASIEQYLHLNPTTGELRLIRQWPVGGGGLPLTLVVRATQADNRDRYALTTLTIVRSTGGATASSNGGGNKLGLVGSGSTTLAPSGDQARAAKRGIEFVQERLLVQVPEDTPVNEKIARVRAHHLQEGAAGKLTPASHNHHQLTESAEPVQAQQQVEHQVAVSNRESRQLPTLISGLAVANQQQPGYTRSASSNTQTDQLLRNSRPINYQILDDQTDQFGINGLGEIFLKRALDYEQRKEFKIRVLATYTKYSDICHVQVAVLNINDNKPKFTQAQYSFHLTESRLRSNLIGLVQAHDADLNDTIQYSILAASGAVSDQQHARLFEINPTGQLSLRSGIRQLNASQCQLIVQASDSLGPLEARHKQQARVNIYVAPQIVGRSLNLNSNEHDQQQTSAAPNQSQADQLETRIRNSHYSLQPTESVATNWPSTTPRKSSRDFAQRLLKEQGSNNNDKRLLADQQLVAESSTVASRHQHQPEVYTTSDQQHQPTPSSQRSSLATVMASLQHMMKSVNFFEMPVSSALLLTVLLTFLVCLLLIVVISMSVHVYRRSSKVARTRRHHHHQRLTAARLRHAHLAGAPTSGPSMSSNSSPYGSSSSSSISSPPMPNTAVGGAVSPLPTVSKAIQTYRKDLNSRKYYDNLALDTTIKIAHKTSGGALASSASGNGNKLEANNSSTNNSSSMTSSTDVATSNSNQNSAQPSRVSSACSPALLPESKQKPKAANNKKRETATTKTQKPDHKRFEALKISISNETTTLASKGNETYLCTIGPGKQNPLYLETSAPTTTTSSKQSALSLQPSELTIGSKSPGLTTDDDDGDNSSSANCGHYSVNGTMEHGRQAAVGAFVAAEGRLGDESRQVADARNKCDNLESAISKLAEQHQHETAREKHFATRATADTNSPDSSERRNRKHSAESYKRLSQMDSLARPLKTQLIGANKFGAKNRVAPIEQLLSSHQQRVEQAAQVAAAAAVAQQHRTAGLMAMVRDSSQPGTIRSNQDDQQEQQQLGQIKWPSESIPQRIKKLTWDDELSCGGGGDNESISLELGANHQLGQQLRLRTNCLNNDDADCYISPDVRLGSASGNLEREMHRYEGRPIGESSSPLQTNQFLFSLNNHMLPSLNLHQHQNQRQSVQTGETHQAQPGQFTMGLDDDVGNHNELTLSHVSGRNQNNCLDYTFVNNSQFHADSLAGVSTSSTARQDTIEPTGRHQHQHYNHQHHNQQQHHGRNHQSDYFARLNKEQTRPYNLDDNEHSLTSSSQTNVTFKLNQNYQDLRLMTTAIL